MDIPSKARKFHLAWAGFLGGIRDLSLLAMRLVLAYGFYLAAAKKLGNLNAVEGWFASLNYPLPSITAPLVAYTEIIGVAFLVAGFGVRYISVPLMIIMIVAITTVHSGNGFKALNNGFEIPLYYFTMLSVLLTHGAGVISLDWLIDVKFR